jgi:hypothetical protein
MAFPVDGLVVVFLSSAAAICTAANVITIIARKRMAVMVTSLGVAL